MSSSPVTLRLSPETRKSVAALARRKRITPSHAMRQAIETWVRNESGAHPLKEAQSFYDKVQDLIGVVHGGNPRRSENTGREFHRLLKEKHNRS